MIKNLLFDLGGVIMDIKRENCIKAFAQLGIDNPGQYLGDYEQSGFFHNIEAGTITPGEFFDEVRRIAPRFLSDEEITVAFCAFLTGIPAHRLHALESLKGRYGIYMLSNTNMIMWDTEIKRQFAQEGHDIPYYFNGTVTSFEAGSCKPEAKIFRFAEKKLGIKPEETLFLDDSEANCEAARALGFQARHVAPGHEFTEVIADLIN